LGFGMIKKIGHNFLRMKASFPTAALAALPPPSLGPSSLYWAVKQSVQTEDPPHLRTSAPPLRPSSRQNPAEAARDPGDWSRPKLFHDDPFAVFTLWVASGLRHVCDVCEPGSPESRICERAALPRSGVGGIPQWQP
jgi:hypothetical protein